ncbi:MAG: transposase [Bacillota bacterium]|nr:transposase [Bacillota bacterium]
MPRQARRKSKSGIYHIIIRGLNRQVIFIDEKDNLRFLETLKRYKEECGYKLYAYCLMGNHLHLLIHIVEEPLEQVMRRVCGSFVYWYNKKYDRTGNLFQNRFRSEAVEDDSYFLTVLRYIHQNPYKAGIVMEHEEYIWSSYNSYRHPETNELNLIDRDFPLKIFGNNNERALKYFIEFHNQQGNDKCLDFKDDIRKGDLEAAEIIETVCGVNCSGYLRNLEKKKRDLILRHLKKEHNLTIRQLEKFTGINRGIIQRA